MKIDIAILEDNPQDFTYLSSLLTDWSNRTCNPVTITRFTNMEIIHAFNEKCFDILFADIELKEITGETGISICKKLRANGFNNEIIFLTAFREYVFDGYNVRAFNYLVKPVSDEVLNGCLKRFIEFHTKDYYHLQDRGTLIQIKFNDIFYITKEGHNIEFHTSRGIFYERSSLSLIADKLTRVFVQCHRSCIVNLSHVSSLSGCSLFMTDGSRITVGRSYLMQVRNAILDYF